MSERGGADLERGQIDTQRVSGQSQMVYLKWNTEDDLSRHVHVKNIFPTSTSWLFVIFILGEWRAILGLWGVKNFKSGYHPLHAVELAGLTLFLRQIVFCL